MEREIKGLVDVTCTAVCTIICQVEQTRRIGPNRQILFLDFESSSSYPRAECYEREKSRRFQFSAEKDLGKFGESSSTNCHALLPEYTSAESKFQRVTTLPLGSIIEANLQQWMDS